MKIRYLLDTHAFVWAAHNPDKLGLKARRVIETAGPDELGISATTVNILPLRRWTCQKCAS